MGALHRQAGGTQPSRRLMAVMVGPGPSFGCRSLFSKPTFPAACKPTVRIMSQRATGQRFLVNRQIGDPTPNPITVC